MVVVLLIEERADLEPLVSGLRESELSSIPGVTTHARKEKHTSPIKLHCVQRTWEL